MKYSIIPALALLMHLNAQAQNFSCGGAARYDANFGKTLEQLEYVTVNLTQGKMARTSDTKAGSANTFYAAQGSTSTAQFTSVEANIGFAYCGRTPSFELYKMQVQNNMRTFTIPAGINGNTAVNIPIQVLFPPSWSPDKRGQSCIKIKFTNGYLSPGEYVLIDKASLTTDGAQMKGVAFSIK